MRSIEDIYRQNIRFAFPTQYRPGGKLGDSIVCFHNFYEQVFRGLETPVDLHLFFFDEHGRQVKHYVQDVATGETFQISARDCGVDIPGLIAVSAIPKFDIDTAAAGRIRLKPKIGTGFYVIWKADSGHLDTMHEWAALSPAPGKQSAFYLVADGGDPKVRRFALVFTNPCLDVAVSPIVEIYDRKRQVLGKVAVDTIPPRGSRMVNLNDIFPTFPHWLNSHIYLGIKTSGLNLVEPFSVEFHNSGDFHIHHIN